MYTVDDVQTMISDDVQNYRKIKNEIREDVMTLERLYRQTFETNAPLFQATPEQTMRAFVEAVGIQRSLVTVATLVNKYAWDGRISRSAANWAISVDGSFDEDAANRMDVYTNIIHLAHLDQIARCAKKI